MVALTCSTPPAGHARWTLELLQERLIQDGIVSGIALETVRLLLKKNKLKPWLVKSWCIPEGTAEFLRKMEHILRLYALPDNLLHPLVCFEEKSIQLLAQTRAVLGCKPGQVTRQDHEYKRNGTRNLFMLVTPKRGNRKGQEWGAFHILRGWLTEYLKSALHGSFPHLKVCRRGEHNNSVRLTLPEILWRRDIWKAVCFLALGDERPA